MFCAIKFTSLIVICLLKDTTAGTVSNFLGEDINLSPWDIEQYRKTAGVGARYPGDLDCDLDNSCCWRNAFSPAAKLVFAIGEGDISTEMLQTTFGTTNMPNGNFLILASNGEEYPMFEAQLISCAIICTDNLVMVSFRKWASSGVQVQVCIRDPFFDHNDRSTLVGCKDTPNKAGEPVSALLPPGESFEIVIVVRNMLASSLVILDDIRVDFTPCPDLPVTIPTTTTSTTTTSTTTTTTMTTPTTTTPTTTTTTTPEPTTTFGLEEACEVVCTYEDGSPCGDGTVILEPGSKVATNQPISVNFEVATGRYGTLVTGISGAVEGDFYIAANLGPNGRAGMEISVGDLSQPVVFRLLSYVATDGIEMLGCCDTMLNCPLKSKFFGPGDRTWKVKSFLCPKGTKTIYFTCSNKGLNLGACGIDDIQLYYPNPQNPTDPNPRTEILTKVCNGDEEPLS